MRLTKLAAIFIYSEVFFSRHMFHSLVTSHTYTKNFRHFCLPFTALITHAYPVSYWNPFSNKSVFTFMTSFSVLHFVCFLHKDELVDISCSMSNLSIATNKWYYHIFQCQLTSKNEGQMAMHDFPYVWWNVEGPMLCRSCACGHSFDRECCTYIKWNFIQL